MRRLARLTAGTSIAADIANAVIPNPFIQEAESRAFESLAQTVLGQSAHQDATEVQLTRVELDASTHALLFRSPEPLDWARTSLTVRQSADFHSVNELPGQVKLATVQFASIRPRDESVSLLLRDRLSPAGYRIEAETFPGPVKEATGVNILLLDSFDGPPSGELFQESFAANALDRYEIIDEGTNFGPSSWTLTNGLIRQTSSISGGLDDRTDPVKPGTMALVGLPSWSNVRISVGLRSNDDDGIGVAFRYRDRENYYLWSMDSERHFRRLIRKSASNYTVLWEDAIPYLVGGDYLLVLESSADQIVGFLNGDLLFTVRDKEHGSGRVGLYCWGNISAEFTSLSVQDIADPLILWQPAFIDLSDLRILDENSSTPAAFRWV
ncbi:MAG: hypothetical protein WKF37_17205, partial [Bryobacteraceae bacterium]